MCGIAGIVTSQDTAPLLPAAVRMTAALAHRGPDSQGVELLPNCILGNRRLAILDLSERGRQPLSIDNGALWITYNGECYNAPALRSLLESRGHSFRSTTDTEVVLRLYREFGEACLSHLRGMFAFAIWDSSVRKLFLARDPLGIKPLYFSRTSCSLLFASEIKSFLASDLILRRLSLPSASAFLQLGHIPPPWTAIEGVEPFLAGEFAVWQHGNLRRERYWTPPPCNAGASTPSPDRAQATVQLGEDLAEAARLHLLSDVPIALFLSGGVDSAIIGALIRQAGASSITALTIGFEEQSFDESDSSARTAALLGLPHRILRLPASAIEGSLSHAISAMDQPTVDGLNTYWISRAVSEAGFKVALSGQGGDELFGGYSSLAWFRRFATAANCLRFLPRSAGSLLGLQSLPFRHRKLSFLVGADDPFLASQLAVRMLFPQSDLPLYLPSAASKNGSVPPAIEHLRCCARESQHCDFLARVASMDIAAHLQPRLLRDGDVMSMAHSLELRPVFLDHHVVERALALPASWRLDRKRLLLEAARPFLPHGLESGLRARPKRTFTFPFSHWLGHQWRASLDEAFDHDRLRAAGVLSPKPVRSLWQRYLRHPDSVGWSRIWSLFILQRWCELMQVHL
jgi:asparagine synthase (glutamine-hydrolysing)